MRILKTLLLVAGVVLLGVLVHRVGTEAILQTLGRLTWWQFLIICLPYAAIMAVDTLGWRFAFARDRASFWRLYHARVIGEALNIVTAVGSVGGEAAKAWLVTGTETTTVDGTVHGHRYHTVDKTTTSVWFLPAVGLPGRTELAGTIAITTEKGTARHRIGQVTQLKSLTPQ